MLTQTLLAANPISDPAAWLVGSVGAYLISLRPGPAFAAAVTTIVPSLTPGTSPLTAAGSAEVVVVASRCGTGLAGGGCGLPSVAGDLRQVGWVLLSVVLLARLLRLAVRGELRSPVHVVFDLFPRIIGGATAIELAGPVMVGVIKLTTAFSFVLAGVFLSVAQIHGPLDVLRDMSAASSMALIAVPLLVTVEFLVYLIEIADVGLLLLALVAPILIPLALYGAHGKVASAWFRAVSSCLLITVIGTVGVAASLALVVLINTIAGPIAEYSGAMAGEAGLLATTVAALVMAKTAFQQVREGVKVTVEGVPLADLPGRSLEEIRRGVDLGVQVGRSAVGWATGNPASSLGLLSAVGGWLHQDGPDSPGGPDGGGSEPGGPQPSPPPPQEPPGSGSGGLALLLTGAPDTSSTSSSLHYARSLAERPGEHD